MEFLKKNYEKVLLGVVLAGLTLAVCLLPFIIAAKRNALESARTSNTPHPTRLDPLVLTNEEAALHRAEAQTSDPRKLAHDLRMGPHPMGEKFLMGHALLAPYQADALDHDISAPPRAGSSPA